MTVKQPARSQAFRPPQRATPPGLGGWRYAAMGLWLIVPPALWIVWMLYGAPHFLFSYRFLDNGEPFNPYAARTYTRCTYIGTYGRFTAYARRGECPWIRWFKPDQ